MSRHYILEIQIEEPTSNPAQPSSHHLLADDLAEAEMRYRSLIQVLVSQLVGLRDTHVRFIVSPADPFAVEAVSFWILPLFRGKVSKLGDHFHFTPEQNAPEFTIEFAAENCSQPSYLKIATLSAHCPQCSSRWINMAMQQCSESTMIKGSHYLTIRHVNQLPDFSINEIPELPMIHTASDWQIALDSPIGPKLQKIYNEISKNI